MKSIPYSLSKVGRDLRSNNKVISAPNNSANMLSRVCETIEFGSVYQALLANYFSAYDLLEYLAIAPMSDKTLIAYNTFVSYTDEQKNGCGRKCGCEENYSDEKHMDKNYTMGDQYLKDGRHFIFARSDYVWLFLSLGGRIDTTTVTRGSKMTLNDYLSKMLIEGRNTDDKIKDKRNTDDKSTDDKSTDDKSTDKLDDQNASGFANTSSGSSGFANTSSGSSGFANTSLGSSGFASMNLHISEKLSTPRSNTGKTPIPKSEANIEIKKDVKLPGDDHDKLVTISVITSNLSLEEQCLTNPKWELAVAGYIPQNAIDSFSSSHRTSITEDPSITFEFADEEFDQFKFNNDKIDRSMEHFNQSSHEDKLYKLMSSIYSFSPNIMPFEITLPNPRTGQSNSLTLYMPSMKNPFEEPLFDYKMNKYDFKPISNKPISNKPSTNKSTSNKSSSNKSNTNKSTSNKPISNKPSTNKLNLYLYKNNKIKTSKENCESKLLAQHPVLAFKYDHTSCVNIITPTNLNTISTYAKYNTYIAGDKFNDRANDRSSNYVNDRSSNYVNDKCNNYVNDKCSNCANDRCESQSSSDSKVKDDKSIIDRNIIKEIDTNNIEILKALIDRCWYIYNKAPNYWHHVGKSIYQNHVEELYRLGYITTQYKLQIEQLIILYDLFSNQNPEPSREIINKQTFTYSRLAFAISQMDPLICNYLLGFNTANNESINNALNRLSIDGPKIYARIRMSINIDRCIKALKQRHPYVRCHFYNEEDLLLFENIWSYSPLSWFYYFDDMDKYFAKGKIIASSEGRKNISSKGQKGRDIACESGYKDKLDQNGLCKLDKDNIENDFNFMNEYNYYLHRHINCNDKNDVNASDKNDVNASDKNDVNVNDKSDINASDIKHKNDNETKNNPNGYWFFTLPEIPNLVRKGINPYNMKPFSQETINAMNKYYIKRMKIFKNLIIMPLSYYYQDFENVILGKESEYGIDWFPET